MLKRLLPLALLAALSCPAATPATHVVVIGLDGCTPFLLREHSAGALRALWQEGAYTWTAEAAVPSVTQVNFAGMLTSSLPAKHGIDQVAWNFPVPPKVKATTIFEVLAARGLSGAAFLGHEKLYPVEKAAAGIHFEHSPHSVRETAPRAARWLREKRPAFTFIYFGDLDGAGHRDGWGSDAQIATMAAINAGVEQVMSAIRESPMRGRTVVIVTSDHGGLGKAHSQGRPEDRAIPWVCWGAGVKRGFALTEPVHNYDTAATALYALGTARPEVWDGRAVIEAFTP
ncbi:MAG TPA: alkaline phosphatase family protein [Opitutaceae bacterium]|nr:alkaline phosphatase family protein [Opitutaceae bacterium]